MSIDSEKKRRRSISSVKPNRILPPADSTIDSDDRAALVGAYYGFGPEGGGDPDEGGDMGGVISSNSRRRRR